jgi:hypothetical protein
MQGLQELVDYESRTFAIQKVLHEWFRAPAFRCNRMRQRLAFCAVQRVAMDPNDGLSRLVLPVETRLLMIPAERVPYHRRLEELDFVGVGASSYFFPPRFPPRFPPLLPPLHNDVHNPLEPAGLLFRLGHIARS